MKHPTLSPVYLDDEPVSMMGDPRPSVIKVLTLAGKKAPVSLADEFGAAIGIPLDLDHVLDRTVEPTKAICLTTAVIVPVGMARDSAIVKEAGREPVLRRTHTQVHRSVLQDWVMELPLMQQSVLLAAVRGADGTPKLHKSKMLVRFLRRCILVSAFDGVALNEPYSPRGGSFTGPSIDDGTWAMNDMGLAKAMREVVDDFIDSRDEMTVHFYAHFMHAAEVVGYKHDDRAVRDFWRGIYERMVHALHVWPETEAQMDKRLGDDPAGWKAREDRSTNCSE